jgi:CubicO group peptidase (beta-lactamase class C family)
VGQGAGVPLRGRWAGVHRRRPLRLRPHAAVPGATARQVTVAVTGIRRGDDHRPIGVDRGAPGPSFDGSQGWGFGVAVQVRRTGLGPTVGGYGWAGGLGSSWANDPAERLVGVVLTTDMFTAPLPPPKTIQDFWTGVYAAIDG